jgi:DNA-binding CsgD family transcriptional regulator
MSAAQPNAEEILCDMEVDGARYLLVRLPEVDRAKIELSPREHEIARMIARGQHNKAIAGVLNISSWTVATHLRRMFSKLGVNSRAAMVARLAESDVLDKSALDKRLDARQRERRSSE